VVKDSTVEDQPIDRTTDFQTVMPVDPQTGHECLRLFCLHPFKRDPGKEH